jgi:hypothetical protein
MLFGRDETRSDVVCLTFQPRHIASHFFQSNIVNKSRSPLPFSWDAITGNEFRDMIWNISDADRGRK